MTSIFRLQPGLVLGVVHLAPLPTSPGFEGDRTQLRKRARRDAEALLEGGVNGLVVENFGDSPFHKDRVEPAVVAEMTRVALALRELAGSGIPVGVNVLRNDGESALAIATAAGLDFVRINVHTGVQFTDQGVIEGQADRTLRMRKTLGSQVAIFADVAVKHATRPQGFQLDAAARDCAYRGHADALIVTGSATGEPLDDSDLERVKEAVPDRPLLAGSGVTPDNIASILARCDGAIVGTAFKEDGIVTNPVDIDRVRELMRNRGP